MVLIQIVYIHTYYTRDIKPNWALGNHVESVNMIIGTRSNYREGGLSVLGGFFNRRSALRAWTTVRSLLQPRDSVAFFRVLFSPTLGTIGGSSVPPPTTAGNVWCFFGTFFLGVAITGVECERIFFPSLDSLDPAACLVRGPGSVRMSPVSVDRF